MSFKKDSYSKEVLSLAASGRTGATDSTFGRNSDLDAVGDAAVATNEAQSLHSMSPGDQNEFSVNQIVSKELEETPTHLRPGALRLGGAWGASSSESEEDVENQPQAQEVLIEAELVNRPIAVEAQAVRRGSNNKWYWLTAGFLIMVALLSILIVVVMQGNQSSSREAPTLPEVEAEDVAPTSPPIEDPSVPEMEDVAPTSSPVQEPVVPINPSIGISPVALSAPTTPVMTSTPTLPFVDPVFIPMSAPTSPPVATSVVTPTPAASVDTPTPTIPTVPVSAPVSVPTSPPIANPNALRADLEPCSTASECANNACGSWGSQSLCCPDGDVMTVSGKLACIHVPAGEVCIFDTVCESGACLNGVCIASRLGDFAECDSAYDCVHRVCGYQEDTTAAPTVCCPSGVHRETNSGVVCARLPVGSTCSIDEICASGKCFEGQCLADSIADGSSCDSWRDCRSNACAATEAQGSAPLVCCANGHGLWYDGQRVCDGGPTGSFCQTDQSCASRVCVDGVCLSSTQTDGSQCDTHSDCSNQLCGKAEFSSVARTVCCESGSGAYNDGELFCEAVDAGSQCSSDQMCASLICVAGICLESPVADGETCDSDTDCASRACGKQAATDSVKVCCSEGRDFDDASGLCGVASTSPAARLSAGSGCSADWECESGACARNEFSAGASFVCCSTLATFTNDVPWTFREERFCGELPTGTPCGTSDLLCSTKMCNGGRCATQRLADQSICSKDSDCQSGYCALQQFSESSGSICCNEGARLYMDVPWTYRELYFCRKQPIGIICGDDQMCESGLCIGQRCVESQLEDSSPCTKNSDCQSRACAYSAYREGANSICCPMGEEYLLEVPWTYRDYYFCGGLPAGSQCGDNRMCASALCVNGSCRDSKLDDLQICSRYTDCNSGSCGLQRYTSDSDSVCCPGGEAHYFDVSWTFRGYWFCGNMPSGTICNDSRQCAGQCVSGVCSA